MGPPGCIACFPARGELRAFDEAADPEGQALLAAACADPDAAMILADWLEERGYVELPRRLRWQEG